MNFRKIAWCILYHSFIVDLNIKLHCSSVCLHAIEYMYQYIITFERMYGMKT